SSRPPGPPPRPGSDVGGTVRRPAGRGRRAPRVRSRPAPCRPRSRRTGPRRPLRSAPSAPPPRPGPEPWTAARTGSPPGRPRRQRRSPPRRLPRRADRSACGRPSAAATGQQQAQNDPDAQGDEGRLHRLLLNPLGQVALGFLKPLGRVVVVLPTAHPGLVVVVPGLLANLVGAQADVLLGAGGQLAQALAFLAGADLEVFLERLEVFLDVVSSLARGHDAISGKLGFMK